MSTPSSLSQFDWLLPGCFHADGRAQRALSALRMPAEGDNIEELVALNVRRMLKVLYPDVIFRVQGLNLNVPSRQSQLRVLFAEFSDSPSRQDVEKALGVWLKVVQPLTAVDHARSVPQGRAQFQSLMGSVYSVEVCSHPAQSLDVEKRRRHHAKQARVRLKASLPVAPIRTLSKPRM